MFLDSFWDCWEKIENGPVQLTRIVNQNLPLQFTRDSSASGSARRMVSGSRLDFYSTVPKGFFSLPSTEVFRWRHMSHHLLPVIMDSGQQRTLSCFPPYKYHPFFSPCEQGFYSLSSDQVLFA